MHDWAVPLFATSWAPEVRRFKPRLLLAWLTLALLMALFVNVPLGVCVQMPIDAGFETGVDGARLSPVWSATGSAYFQNYDYDDGDIWPAKVGSKYAYFKGPASTAYSDITAASPISTDDSSISTGTTSTSTRTTATSSARSGPAPRIGTYWLRMDSAGNIGAYTSKTGVTGYTTGTYMPIGTMPTGWTQVKMTLNFTSDTYTFSTRPDTASAWTPMKAAGAPDYNIPMRGVGQPGLADHADLPGGRRDRHQRRVRPRRRELRHPDALGSRRHLRGRRPTAPRSPPPGSVRAPPSRPPSTTTPTSTPPSRARSTATSRARPPRRRPRPTS